MDRKRYYKLSIDGSNPVYTQMDAPDLTSDSMANESIVIHECFNAGLIDEEEKLNVLFVQELDHLSFHIDTRFKHVELNEVDDVKLKEFSNTLSVINETKDIHSLYMLTKRLNKFIKSLR